MDKPRKLPQNEQAEIKVAPTKCAAKSSQKWHLIESSLTGVGDRPKLTLWVSFK
jgi:hypothetical protein